MARRENAISAYSTAESSIAALRARKVSAVELLDRSVARIEAHDDELNAVVVRDFDRARKAAHEADQALARGDRRPLLGLPITVKEAFNVAGLPTTWGIPGTKELPVTDDAVVVRRLKAAGAIVIGKTNVPVMLADWQSFNPVYGVTNNPWDVSRTPGGSSGGAAAVLAAGYVSLEVGSDLNNSLRAPAHFCGVFAHKPTHGLVPMRGFAPPGTPQFSVGGDIDLGVLGPMARSATDLALELSVIAGPDDAQAGAYKLNLPEPRHADLKGFRVLVIDQHPLLAVGNAVHSAIEEFAANLAKTGCQVARESSMLPDLALIAQTYGRLLMSFVTADMPEDARERMRAAAAALPPNDDSIVAINLRAGVMSHAEWIKTDRLRMFLAHQWAQLFRDWDVVVCPVLPTPAFPHDHRDMDSRLLSVDGKEIPYGLQSVWASVATLTGLPATAMPVGLSSEGLPVGVQIVGPYLEDRTTIRFAELAEREFGGFVPPPAFAEGN